MSELAIDSLVYVSSAVKLLEKKEIEHLLTRARQRNQEYGITGVLLYIGGNFMQYIEGTTENLELIYKIICEDSQHTGIILVSRELVEARQFADWSMAYHTRDASHFVGPDSERELLEENLVLPTDNSSTARIVLHSFWHRGGT